MARSSRYIAACLLLVTIGCSTDPHNIVIGTDSKDSFAKLAREGKGLTPEELSLLKAAEVRIQKEHAGDKVVGKKIADVIADEREWLKQRDQLSRDLEPLYRAAKAIQAATSVGVTYLKYRELLQACATEYAVAKDKTATDEEKRVVELFRSALAAYQDAGTLWQHQISNAQYEDLFGGGVSYSIQGKSEGPDIVRIVEGYQIPIRDGRVKYTQAPYQAIPKNSMQTVWLAADKRMTDAVDAYTAK